MATHPLSFLPRPPGGGLLANNMARPAAPGMQGQLTSNVATAGTQALAELRRTAGEIGGHCCFPKPAAAASASSSSCSKHSSSWLINHLLLADADRMAFDYEGSQLQVKNMVGCACVPNPGLLTHTHLLFAVGINFPLLTVMLLPTAPGVHSGSSCRRPSARPHGWRQS
jgi:hypothetical protein